MASHVVAYLAVLAAACLTAEGIRAEDNVNSAPLHTHSASAMEEPAKAVDGVMLSLDTAGRSNDVRHASVDDSLGCSALGCVWNDPSSEMQNGCNADAPCCKGSGVCVVKVEFGKWKLQNYLDDGLIIADLDNLLANVNAKGLAVSKMLPAPNFTDPVCTQRPRRSWAIVLAAFNWAHTEFHAVFEEKMGNFKDIVNAALGAETEEEFEKARKEFYSDNGLYSLTPLRFSAAGMLSFADELLLGHVPDELPTGKAGVLQSNAFSKVKTYSEWRIRQNEKVAEVIRQADKAVKEVIDGLNDEEVVECWDKYAEVNNKDGSDALLNVYSISRIQKMLQDHLKAGHGQKDHFDISAYPNECPSHPH